MEDQLYIAKDRDGRVFLYSGRSPKIIDEREWSNNTLATRIHNHSILDGFPWDKSLHIATLTTTPIIPEELKVDDKVWVWDIDGETKLPRYFSSYSKDRVGIYCFVDGTASFSANHTTKHWKFWKKA